MQEILRAPAPYGMIKDAESLIQTVESINTALVTKRRDRALHDIDTLMGKVQVELDDAKASGNLRNQCLYPLQTLKRAVETQTSIAHVDQARQGATDALDEAFAKIEAAAKQTKKTGGIGDKDDKVYVKPRRVVKVAALAPSSYLEIQDDIDAYLSKLRKALEHAVAAGERAEIRSGFPHATPQRRNEKKGRSLCETEGK